MQHYWATELQQHIYMLSKIFFNPFEHSEHIYRCSFCYIFSVGNFSGDFFKQTQNAFEMTDASKNSNKNWLETSSYNEEDFFTHSDDEVYDDEEVEGMPLVGTKKSSKKKKKILNVATVGDVKWTKSGFKAPNFVILEEEP